MNYTEQGELFDKLSDAMAASRMAGVWAEKHYRECEITGCVIHQCQSMNARLWKENNKRAQDYQWELLTAVGVTPTAVLLWQEEAYPKRREAREAATK